MNEPTEPTEPEGVALLRTPARPEVVGCGVGCGVLGLLGMILLVVLSTKQAELTVGALLLNAPEDWRPADSDRLHASYEAAAESISQGRASPQSVVDLQETLLDCMLRGIRRELEKQDLLELQDRLDAVARGRAPPEEEPASDDNLVYLPVPTIGGSDVRV